MISSVGSYSKLAHKCNQWYRGDHTHYWPIHHLFREFLENCLVISTDKLDPMPFDFFSRVGLSRLKGHWNRVRRIRGRNTANRSIPLCSIQTSANKECCWCRAVSFNFHNNKTDVWSQRKKHSLSRWSLLKLYGQKPIKLHYTAYREALLGVAY